MGWHYSIGSSSEIPQAAEKLQKARSNPPKKFQNQAKSAPANLPVDALTIASGFLLNQNDSNCLQLSKIVPNVSGAVHLSFDDARPWLERKIILSQDEMAVIVIGACGHSEPDQCHKIHVPVCLNNEPLIVQRCLHQLRAKHVKLASDEESCIPEMCFTAVRAEITQVAWKSLIESPVKHMLNGADDRCCRYCLCCSAMGKVISASLERWPH